MKSDYLMKSIQQGTLYLADLNPIKGHEQGGLRPVLVLQNNTLNRYLSTVVIAPITSNLEAKGLMTTYFIPAQKSQLKKDSVALLFQVRTIDKGRLKKPLGKITGFDFSELRVRLMRIFF